MWVFVGVLIVEEAFVFPLYGGEDGDTFDRQMVRG